jgi:hypothetical protein
MALSLRFGSLVRLSIRFLEHSVKGLSNTYLGLAGAQANLFTDPPINPDFHALWN